MHVKLLAAFLNNHVYTNSILQHTRNSFQILRKDM